MPSFAGIWNQWVMLQTTNNKVMDNQQGAYSRTQEEIKEHADTIGHQASFLQNCQWATRLPLSGIAEISLTIKIIELG